MIVGSSTRIQTENKNLSMENDPFENYLTNNGNKISSEIIQEVASTTIIDSLANQWWSINLSETVINDLLENLIPLIILACEKVLNEADERQLILITHSDRSFNPINHLASFLMRNNPKYMHYSSLSPYHYSMKSLLNTKKLQVLKVYGEEETLLHQILKQRQNQRVEQREIINLEQERRKQSLKTLFHDWNVPERGWIQTKLINNMIEEYNKLEKPNDLQLNLPLFQSHRMHLGTFTENFLNVLNNQSSKNFDLIINLYRRCTQTYTNIVQEYELDQLLQRLFIQLDDKQIDLLYRKKVMKILETFYNLLNDQDKQLVNQPDQWPVVKQTIVNENSSEIEQTEEESPIKNDDEQTENEEKDVHIQLKPPSAYEPNFRFTKEQKQIYNLEHFDTKDFENSIPFDDEFINKIQFSSLLISFIGFQSNEMVTSALIDYFRSNYVETSEEKTQKKQLLQQRQTDIQRRLQCDLLFEKLNTTCTGHIKLEILTNYLKQYKDGAANEQIEQVLQPYQDRGVINNTQFYDALINIYQTVNETVGGGEKFDDLLKYIENQQPSLNATDRTRVHTRFQWLKRLREISFRSLGQLYKEVMEIIQKDADTFGNQPSKNLSIYIGLLENDKNHLRYVATTNDQTDLLLGKTLQRDQGISFQILDNGKWAYINQTKNHSRIHFFNRNSKNQSGSFVLLPLKNFQDKYSNGVLGIDTIRDKKEKAFVQHEVQFYEGIASVLSEAFSRVCFDENLMKILHRFIYWIKQRCTNVLTVDYYSFEPTSLNNPKQRLLKHVFRYSNGNLTNFSSQKLINSREEIFTLYLEHAAVTCQSTITSFFDQIHMVQTMRGKDNFCFGLIDTNCGENLPNEQKQDLLSMYRCVNTGIDELEQELNEDTEKQLLTYEKNSNDLRLKYLFDRIWFMDISNQIKQISSELIDNKIKSTNQLKQILSTISRIVTKKEFNLSEYDEVLLPAMIQFDPTSDENNQNHLWNLAEQTLESVTFHQSKLEEQNSSDLLKLFYDWLFISNELYKNSKIN